MLLRPLCLLLLVLAGAPALAQEGEELRPEKHVSPTPPWLPRGVFLGSFLNTGEVFSAGGAPLVVTPQLRAQWEYTIIQERVDAFVLVAEVGGGWAVKRTNKAGVAENLTMQRFSQLVGIVGAGYRGTQPGGLHFGAHAGVGPLLYSARFEGLPPGLDTEQFLGGLVEARAQIGYRFGKDLVLGLSVGYGSPFGRPARSIAGEFTGGFLLGLFADWR